MGPPPSNLFSRCALANPFIGIFESFSSQNGSFGDVSHTKLSFVKFVTSAQNRHIQGFSSTPRRTAKLNQFFKFLVYFTKVNSLSDMSLIIFYNLMGSLVYLLVLHIAWFITTNLTRVMNSLDMIQETKLISLVATSWSITWCGGVLQ